MRKFFFRPAEEAGIGEDWILFAEGGRILSGAFWACRGLSLSRTLCRRWWVASFWLFISSMAVSRARTQPIWVASSVISEGDIGAER